MQDLQKAVQEVEYKDWDVEIKHVLCIHFVMTVFRIFILHVEHLRMSCSKSYLRELI